MAHETDLRGNHFVAGTTPKITYTLKDAAGATITAALDTQTATIYTANAKQVLTGWIDKDIDGAQGNTVTSGIGVWNLPPGATAMIDTLTDVEDHVIAIKFTYDTDKVGEHRLIVQVHRSAPAS